MADLLNLGMLLGACVAALAFGVFAAYGILRVGFFFMRPRRTAAVPSSREMAQIS